MIKILIGGSPCTHWSVAQKNSRETEPKGLGWELFKNFLIAKEKYNPHFFMYENNKSAAEPIKQQISRELKAPLQYINSSLVSAQNRQRFYVHNIPNVPLPEDKGIFLKDIIESGANWTEKAYYLTATYNGAVARNSIERSQRTMIAEPVCDIPLNTTADGKAGCIRATCYKDGIRNLVAIDIDRKTCIATPVRVAQINKGGQGDRIYSVYGKSVCISANGGGRGAKCGLYAIPLDKSKSSKVWNVYPVENGLITINDKKYNIRLPDGYYIIRKLSVLECKRLQTVPDEHLMPCSVTQNYKMLGNGWTIDIITHILSNIPNIRNKPIEVLSMYDGMSCGQIALGKLGAKVTRYYATEIDKYAIMTTMANYPATIQLGDAFNVRNNDWILSGAA